MADNNSLVFYQQWAVAWLQMDKYSTNPWCVDSKNLDIFSDTQSAKGTAWSTATAIPSSEWVDEDEKGRFKLADDGKVYDSLNEVWLDHTFFDTNASKVDYLDWEWSNKADYWEPLKLFVVYEWDVWRNITVITDRTWHTRYNDWVHSTVKEVTDTNSAVSGTDLHGDSSYVTVSMSSSNNFETHRTLPAMTWGRVKMTLDVWQTSNPLDRWKIIVNNHKLKRDESIKWWKNDWVGSTTETAFTWDVTYEWYVDWFWWAYGQNIYIQSKLANEAYKFDETFYINEKWDYMLPWDKEFIKIDWTWYMFVPDQNLYEEIDFIKQYDADGNSYWTVITAWSFEVREWEQIAALTKTFDYRLAFVNKPSDNIGKVYLVPAWDDILNFQQCWDFPWLKFINAIMVNGYSYVIAEERGIRWLYVFYNWQTKKIVGADTKYTEAESLMDGKEIYNFTWPMLNWRGHVVAPTVNGIYMYWENKRGQNVWSFILKVDWTINKMFVNENNQLRVEYTSWANSYYRLYQDDIVKKNYESDWSITYPVQIWSHMFEKEVRDLEVSYSLPNSSTSLDVYVSVNDYYFWSFLTSWVVTAPDVWAKFKASWLSWNYWLEFVEKDWNWLTFKLTWDLPYQTLNTKNLVSEDNSTTIAYTDFNHFKKIGTCSKTDPFMKEGKARIFKIAADNELPIVRKMQIRVDWHTDTHNSPLLYSIRLLSDQKDR